MADQFFTKFNIRRRLVDMGVLAGDTYWAEELAIALTSSPVAPIFISESGIALAASGVAPVTGTFAATGFSAAFIPLAGRAFNISLSGTFVETIRLVRSFDAGVTKLPLTAGGFPTFTYTTPCSESFQESEFGVSYYLECTARTSGTATYRISQ